MTNIVKSPYINPAIHDVSAAKSFCQQAQSNFSSSNVGYQGHLSRGSDALAHIIADLYVSIETILASTTADVQALMLMEYHVKPANGSASEFGPWIKVATGRPKPNGKMKKALNGLRYPEWEANRAFEKYFHVMEELRFNNVIKDHADYIKKAGGAMAIVEARQKRVKEDGDEGRKATVNEQRELLLSEGTGIPFKLGFQLPQKCGEFFSIVCQRIPDGDPVMLGIVRADADKDLTALAAQKFDILQKARAEREAEEAKRAAAAEAARIASENAERNFLKVILDPEKLAVMQAAAKRRHDDGELDLSKAG